MNTISTPGEQSLAGNGKFFVKIAVTVMAVLCGLSVSVKAQNTDLPNPTANLQTAPAGSLVIAMDNTNQARPGYFNLKAYGLAVYLMNNNKRLRWVIKAGKAKDGIDFSVNASPLLPVVVTATSKITVHTGSPVADVSNIVGTLVVGMTVTAPGVPAGTTIVTINNATKITLSANATSNQTNKDATYSINTYPVTAYNFKAGPFIIFPADTAGVSSLISGFNSGLVTTERVNVFRTSASVTVDVRYDMLGVKPKGAILDDGGNGNIHIQYMVNAAIPVQNYHVLFSATGLTSQCFTFASEPHNDNQGAFIDSIKKFVQLGGNFLAQCHAITSYENWATGRFQTTLGVNDVNTNLNANTAYNNSDLSISQFEGLYKTNDGGSVQTWTYLLGSLPKNNFYPVVRGNTVPLANTFAVTGAKLKTGKGGNVYYLGNHNYTGTAIERLNGQRIYLNAFLTPAATPACPEAIILPVTLNYFTARKADVKKVQVNWSTANEQNAKEYIIERSADGQSFAEVSRVNAKGNSSVESIYNLFDHNPFSGKNFYRLVQVDKNGAKVYSSIVIVKMDIETAAMDIFPNPARGQVNINLNNTTGHNNSLSVFDMTGKPVINQMQMTGNATKLDIAGLQPGSYIVKVVTADGKMIQNKLLVVK